jgi:hypothetical protein
MPEISFVISALLILSLIDVRLLKVTLYKDKNMNILKVSAHILFFLAFVFLQHAVFKEARI